eukprot:979322-Amphidinium_carterae.1
MCNGIRHRQLLRRASDVDRHNALDATKVGCTPSVQFHHWSVQTDLKCYLNYLVTLTVNR